MELRKRAWLEALGEPSYGFKAEPLKLRKKYEYPAFTAELYEQKNGPDTVQRVMKVFPTGVKTPCPAVAVPFYFPEAMLGFEPETGEELPYYAGVELMVQLAKRGYASASADAYHLTYLQSDKERGDFSRWKDAGEAVLREHPHWTGMGKLVSDTKLLVDALAEDPRVDADRIGIAGHSLGGKMAFYAGCLDERVKVILSSDMGLGWDQTNWRDVWYWDDKVEVLIAKGMDHADLLGCTGGKPFCLIAGEFDNMDSWDMMCKAPGYAPEEGKLKIINHATGHRPPMYALQEGYDFLDRWLK